MKTAGEILSALFDERFVEKAQGYSKLYNSWTDVTEKNGIAAAAAHSRIKDLDRGILLVETDHPGWKQILQTKQGKLLSDYRRRFPDLDISGISFMLGRSEHQTETSSEEKIKVVVKEELPVVPEQTPQNYNDIKDEEFKQTLKRLGQNIAAREKSG